MIATAAGTVFSVGDILAFSVAGTTLTVKRNGTTVLTITDGNLTTGTRAGLWSNSAGSAFRFDDFTVS